MNPWTARHIKPIAMIVTSKPTTNEAVVPSCVVFAVAMNPASASSKTTPMKISSTDSTILFI
jgi:hypothetical protein